MNELLSANSFFFVLLTVLAFSLGSWIQKKGKLAILNPLLLSSLLVVLVLNGLEIPNSAYQAGCKVLSFLLTPATICLAISFYEQFQTMKKHLVSIVLGLLAGTVCCLSSVWLLANLFGYDRVLLLSLLPKSITTAIGVPVAQELGGIAAITSACIALTGVLANMLGPVLAKVCRITDPIAMGVGFGTSGHVIGTAKAAEISQLAGAVSSFALTITGIVTTVLLSLLSQFL